MAAICPGAWTYVFITWLHFVEGKCQATAKYFSKKLLWFRRLQLKLWSEKPSKSCLLQHKWKNDSWLLRSIGMFCILRLQIILVKRSMCPSNTTFSIVDIVSEGIQESKEAGDPSRQLVIQHLSLSIFSSTSRTLSFYFTHTQTHTYIVQIIISRLPLKWLPVSGIQTKSVFQPSRPSLPRVNSLSHKMHVCST